jgi:dTDP-4-amino-4,6-dideoxygalactose transaminase
MMITNSTPNIPLGLLMKQFLVKHARHRCEEWFRQYTGKRHVLLTSSCRSALYLAHIANENKGDVITSPLTCTSALDPVLAADRKIRFCDIRKEDLLMKTPKAGDDLSDGLGAVQAIHHGGVLMKLKPLEAFAKTHNLLLVEDCGQCFGLLDEDLRPGMIGDVACFSLIKNGNSLGGGVLATNNTALYKQARKIQLSWKKESRILLLFRFIRTAIEENRSYGLVNKVYNLLMKARPVAANPYDPKNLEKQALRQPLHTFFRLFVLQASRLQNLHTKRTKIADALTAALKDVPIRVIGNVSTEGGNTYDKFFIVLPQSNVAEIISGLLKQGIEARHLENRYGSLRQPRLDELSHYASSKGLADCTNYFELHDRILQLPLHEKMISGDIQKIVTALTKLLV